MKSYGLLIAVCLLPALLFSQKADLKALKLTTIDSSKNIISKPLFSDSLSSSFYLIIQNEVKLHKHLHHSEHVVVLSGTGIFQLRDTSFTVKTDDIIFIPRNTPHKLLVTEKPFHCISIQSPFFDGTDRVLLE